jgi:hypothetical protein
MPQPALRFPSREAVGSLGEGIAAGVIASKWGACTARSCPQYEASPQPECPEHAGLRHCFGLRLLGFGLGAGLQESCTGSQTQGARPLTAAGAGNRMRFRAAPISAANAAGPHRATKLNNETGREGHLPHLPGKAPCAPSGQGVLHPLPGHRLGRGALLQSHHLQEVRRQRSGRRILRRAMPELRRQRLGGTDGADVRPMRQTQGRLYLCGGSPRRSGLTPAVPSPASVLQRTR